jgi:hypothetical protein
MNYEKTRADGTTEKGGSLSGLTSAKLLKKEV